MRNERGISLLEIVVSVALMAVVLLFLSRGFMTSMYMTRQSDEFTAAARAAREKMEEIVSSTIRQYDRVMVTATTYNLQIDPLTGQYKTKLNAFTFNELPEFLKLECVGGPRINGIATIPTTQVIKAPIMSGATTDPFGRLHPFRVYLNDSDPNDPDSTKGLLAGLVDDYAGEVVVVNSEVLENFAIPDSGGPVINPANIDHVRGIGSYAGDLLPRDGQPDGFMYFRLPIDLNSDGDFNDTAQLLRNTQVKLRKYAIGVIIRWQGRYGPERHETWTILSED